MDWLEISIDTTPNRLDELCALLSGRGFDSLQIEDGRDIDRPDAVKDWETCDPELLRALRTRFRVTLYLPDAGRLPDIEAVLHPEYDRMSVRSIPEDSWAESWKQFYRPIPIGRRLLIHPSWLPVKNAEGRAVFLNNPGMSFGTGEHETTRLCLAMLDARVAAGHTILDIGCGSGILFICALLLGAKSAVAVEIDPFAAEIADQNARQNGQTGHYQVLTGDPLHESLLPPDARFDLITTNIVADVVVALIPLVLRHLARGGQWIVSGVIDTYRDDVLSAAARAGFTLLEEASEHAWHGFVFGRGSS